MSTLGTVNKKPQVTIYRHGHTSKNLYQTNLAAKVKLCRYVLLNSYKKALFLKEVLRSTDAIFRWYVINRL